MEEKKGISLDELYDHITKLMTPEQALKKFLEGGIIKYENLKFNEDDTPIHPVFIISMAAMDLGWQFGVEQGKEDVEGVIVGTEEYMDRMLKSK